MNYIIRPKSSAVCGFCYDFDKLCPKRVCGEVCTWNCGQVCGVFYGDEREQ